MRVPASWSCGRATYLPSTGLACNDSKGQLRFGLEYEF